MATELNLSIIFMKVLNLAVSLYLDYLSVYVNYMNSENNNQGTFKLYNVYLIPFAPTVILSAIKEFNIKFI